MAATLECSSCGHTESPLRHTYQSNCGGMVAWERGTLRCQRCDMHIYIFRCDDCGERLGQRNVS